MSKPSIRCEVSDVTLRHDLRTEAHANTLARTVYIVVYKPMYVRLYVMLYTYATGWHFGSANGHNTLQIKHLSVFRRVWGSQRRNLANISLNLALSRGYIESLGPNLATTLLNSLEMFNFARLARLGLGVPRIRKLHVRPCTRTYAHIGKG